jgi:hypothetical protein
MGDSIQGDGELMGRFTRHSILVLGLILFLPGITGAQDLQNSATGELNTLSLDLSQATVTLTRSSLVDPGNSTVTVDPPIVTADGIAFSTITVTLRDGLNQPVTGRAVSLASSRGALDTVTQPLNPTDSNGVTTGEIRSTLNGPAQIQATEVQEGVLLNDQPQVLFTLAEVLLLTKTVSPDKATVGDVVTYSVAPGDCRPVVRRADDIRRGRCTAARGHER